MKRIIITLSIISVLFLAGCKSNENELPLNSGNQQIVSEDKNMNQDNKLTEADRIKSLLSSEGGWSPVMAHNITDDDVAGLFDIYGSGIHYGWTLEFEEDGTFAKMIGVYGEDYTGKYEIDIENKLIYFVFDSGRKMEGSYSYMDGKIMSVNIIEELADIRYRVTLNKAENEDEIIDVNLSVMDKLSNSEWVKENLTMNQDCFGEIITANQKLSFEKIEDDLVVVQAYCEEENNLGTQIFLVGYKNGKVKIMKMPIANPKTTGYELDIENKVLLEMWGNLTDISYSYHKLTNLGIEEIERLTYYEAQGDIWDGEKVTRFLEKYNTEPINNPL